MARKYPWLPDLGDAALQWMFNAPVHIDRLWFLLLFVLRELTLEAVMKAYKIGLGMLASFGLGAGVVEGLHAQASPPAYVISEIDVSNAEAYAKEYVPLANKALADSGQKRLVSGGKTISLSGAPPASRIVVSMFENLEKAKEAYSSPAYLQAREIGNQYGKLRIFAVEGIAQ
jgi:uncharacterized protein (DUF1330 family)